MALCYVLDEHLRGSLWRAIRWHNGRGANLLDAVRVGDPPDLPLGSSDPDILLWAERENRILVSRDHETMPGHLAAHLRSGRSSPGVFLVRLRPTLAQVVAFLIDAAHASDPADWQDRVEYIP